MQQPVQQWINENGTVVKIFATDEPFKFRVTKNDEAWNPNDMVAKATK